MAMHCIRKSILFKIFALCNIIAVMLLMSACIFTASATTASSGLASEASAPVGAKSAGNVDAGSANTEPRPENPAYTSMQAENLPPGTAASIDRQPEKGEPGISTLRCIHFNEKDFRNSIALAGSAADNAGTGANGSFSVDSSSGDSVGASRGDGMNSSGDDGIDISSSDGMGSSSGNGNTDYPAGSIAGGVVPHHLLAGKMIAQFFLTLSESSPGTIVIIGPNHNRTGMNKLHTSSLDWATAFGLLENDREITRCLVKELVASENTGLMETEHSISSLVPYVKYYMPKTKIVPILLHGNYTVAESQKLGKFLAGIIKDDPGIAVIASVDFSHYLDADTADKMDRITLDAIISRDTFSISRMGNDNIDSPPSILSLLCAMDEIGAIGPEVTDHDNSFGITGIGAEYTTSYFTMFFRRP
jgi:AmmeMemoRadiSam system protein B